MVALVALISIFAAVLVGCGPSNVGERVEEGEGTTTTAAAAGDEEAAASENKVGDTVEVADPKHTITLEDVNWTGGVVSATVVIDNTGDSELNVSSLVGFEAKDDAGNKGDYEMSSDGLDGSVLAGDKLRGKLSYKFSAEPASAKLYYKPNLFGGGAIVFILK